MKATLSPGSGSATRIRISPVPWVQRRTHVPKMSITINGLRPLALTKRDAARALGNKMTLLNRMIWCARHQPDDPWVVIVTNRSGSLGTELTLDTDSVEKAYERLCAGEQPPLLPSECLQRRKPKAQEKHRRN